MEKKGATKFFNSLSIIKYSCFPLLPIIEKLLKLHICVYNEYLIKGISVSCS